jgi:hypothetical protein
MHDKLIIPKAIVLALACYYAISACRGRIQDLSRWGGPVYSSEQPAKFWACTLGWAINFATLLIMLHYDHSARTGGTVAVTGFNLCYLHMEPQAVGPPDAQHRASLERTPAAT